MVSESFAALAHRVSVGERRLLLVMASALGKPDPETGECWATCNEAEFLQFGRASDLGTLTDAVESLRERRVTWVDPQTLVEHWFAVLNQTKFNRQSAQWRLRVPPESAEALRNAQVLAALRT